MTKLEYEQLLKPLIEIYDEIERKLMVSIVKRIDNYSGMKGTLKWYTDKLNELKLLDRDSLEVFKENRKALLEKIEELTKDCGYKIDNLERLEDYYNTGLIDINPFSLYESQSINTMISEAIKDTKDILDLIETKAIEGTNKEYKRILNQAYIETASGIYTYTESIRHAIDDMASNGIYATNYKSGRQLSIESVVRRDVITRMNKLVGSVELEHAKQLGTNLVYVDQHLGARVRTKYMKHDYEAHAEWQGKKYMVDGSSEDYPNLYEKTGYGEMLGLKGINCYHNLRPTWSWETIDPQIDLQRNKEEYEKLQEMRRFERGIRKLKRKYSIAKYQNDLEEKLKIDTKLNNLQDDYNKYLEDNHLKRDYNREYISKYKLYSIEFQEEYFKEFENLDKETEHLFYYNLETGKQVGKIASGISNQVKPSPSTIIKLLMAKEDSLLAVHNHPRNTSFSRRDIKTFNNSKELGMIVVRTDDYIYVLSTGKGHKINSKDSDKFIDDKYSRIQKEVKKENLNYIEERHKINQVFAKEMGWKYGRVKNDKND